MPEHAGRLGPVGRVAIIVSRYNEIVTGRLLEGARQCCRDARIADRHVDVLWVAGAFELPVLAEEAARSGPLRLPGGAGRGDAGRHAALRVRGGRGHPRPRATWRAKHALPVGFGLLTVDTMQQALDRAGGTAGNKGYEAAEAAITAADTLARLRRSDAPA